MKNTDARELGDLAIHVLRLQVNYEYQPRDQRNSPEYRQLGRNLKTLRTRVLRAAVDQAILEQAETFDLAMRVSATT
jgi:hypothetical protein